MPFRRLKRRFEHQPKGGNKIVFPAGWAGEMSDDVARLADKAGATYQDAKAEKPKAPKADKKAIAEADKAVADAEKMLAEAVSDEDKAAAGEVLAEAKAARADLDA